MIMPVPFAIFREIHLICSIQFSLLSIMIPRNLAPSTSWILDPFIWMVGQISFLPLGLNFYRYSGIIYWHLTIPSSYSIHC